MMMAAVRLDVVLEVLASIGGVLVGSAVLALLWLFHKWIHREEMMRHRIDREAAFAASMMAAVVLLITITGMLLWKSGWHPGGRL